MINIYSAKADYVHPLKNNIRFDAGFKVRFVKNDNEIIYDRYDGGWKKDDRSNHFIYEENINAAHASINKKWKKWSAQTGLRLENTTAKGNLLPQYAHYIELRHTLNGKFTTTVNYTVTNDVISQLLKQNTEKRTTFQTTDNVARFKNIGIAINMPVQIVKWWSTKAFLNVFNNQYEGIYYNSFTGRNDPIDINYTSMIINITNTFSFSKGWSGEISGWYRGKTIEQLTIAEPMYLLNLGVQKNVLKGKGTWRMNIRDPFHWQQYKGYTTYSDVDVKLQNRWDNRSLTLNFSYRFGKTTVAQARKRSTGASEEQNRAGGQQ